MSDAAAKMTTPPRAESSMEVYLVPIGPRGYELYYEGSDDDVPEDAVDLENGDDPGLVGRFYRRFREILAEAQEARRAKRLAAVPTDPAVGQPWLIRVRNWLISWVAETIADWRLLWHMRTRDRATLWHPDDLDRAEAERRSRATLGRDADRHRLWMIIDAIITVILGPLLFFVPGPNLIAYYFAFRTVGHWLAWRGARNGLDRVTWTTRASTPLGALRQVLSLDPAARAQHIRDISAELQLEHLAAFVERMVAGSRRRASTA